MSDVRRFTSSELRLYQRCRRSWYLRYYLGYAPRRDAGDVSVSRVGTLVHLGVEHYYKTGDTAESLERVAHTVERNLSELAEAGRDTKKVASNGDLVRIMLEGYFDWLEETGVDSDLEIQAVEEEIEHPLLYDGDVTLLGKVDWKAIRRSTGKVLIVDTKTVAGARDQEVLAHLNLQFKHYAAISTALGEDVEGVRVRWLRRVKRTARSTPPFYGEVPVEYPKAVLRSYWDHATAIAEEILATEAKLRSGVSAVRAGCGPTVDRACGYCSFRPVCPMLDDETVDETDMLQWSYEKVDPLSRYGHDETEDEDE